MPRVCFPVGWSSLRTTETSAQHATSLRFRPSMKLTPLTASSKTSFGLHITIIHIDRFLQPGSQLPLYFDSGSDNDCANPVLRHKSVSRAEPQRR